MITKSAQVSAILANPSHTARVRVEVADSGGTLRDIGALTDFDDPTLSVEMNEDVDTHKTATITVRRQVGLRSLAPEVLGASNPLQPSTAVVEVGRQVVIYVSVQPVDGDDSSLGTELEVFNGYIDQIDWPEDDMQLTCSDFTAKLRDRFIEWERVYGLCTGGFATAGAYVWRNKADAKVLAVGDLVVPSKMNANGHFYRVTAAASAQAVAEPAWPTGGGSTVVSGGVTLTESGSTSGVGDNVEDIMQNILNDNGLSAVTLYVPSSPTWVILPYIQQRQSVLEALEVFATQIGWLLEWRWDNGTSQFRLTFYAPDRASTTSVKTIVEDEETSCNELKKDIFDIRNAVRIIYGDSGTLDGDGNFTRIATTYEDAASIAKYGRRFMEVAEADISNIDSASEASTLGNAILADLKEPVMMVGSEFPIDPYLQVGDMVTIPADQLRFSVDQKLAIFSISTSLSAESQRTKITLRGQPSAGLATWLMLDVRVSEDTTHLIQNSDSLSVTQTNTATVGGTRVTIQKNVLGGKKLADSHELHVSTTPGFTASSATLKGSGRSNQLEALDLVPGKVYYQQLIPFTFNDSQKVYGAPSVETSFTAGRAKAGHYDSSSTQSHLPLNGNFEHALDDLNTVPFDHWSVVTRPTETTEAWGSGGSVFWGNSATTKGNYIILRASATQRGNLVSDPFEVRRGVRAFNVYLSIRRQGSSAASGKDLIVDVQTYSDISLTTLVDNNSLFFSGDSAGPYPTLNTWYEAKFDFGALGSSANFMVISLRRGTTGDSSFSWEVGDVYVQEADFNSLRVTTLTSPAIVGPTITGTTTIDQEAWTAASYANSFVDFDSANYTPGGYMKDSMGFVHLRGLVKRASAALSTTIFTLASGYRPAKLTEFIVLANGNAARLEIATSGAVQLVSAVDASWFSFFSLDGLTFDTR